LTSAFKVYTLADHQIEKIRDRENAIISARDARVTLALARALGGSGARP